MPARGALDALDELQNMARVFLSQVATEWNKEPGDETRDIKRMNECAMAASSGKPKRFTLRVFEGGKPVKTQ